MVLDESALEAMLARQRAAEANHASAPSLRTHQTEEFEVYERQPASQAQPLPAAAQRFPAPPQPSPAAQPAPGAAPPGPATYSAGLLAAPRALGDFEELPGRQQGQAPAPQALPRAEHAPAPAPAPARAHEPAQTRAHEPDLDVSHWHTASSQPGPGIRAPPAVPHAPQTQPRTAPAVAGTAPATTGAADALLGSATPAAPSLDRRPQVWPPIRRPDAAPGLAFHDEPAPQVRPSAPAPPAASPAAEPPRQALGGAEHGPPTHAPGASHGTPSRIDGSGCRIAIVQADFNAEITDAMARLATQRAREAGAQASLHHVPGVFDLPLMVQHMARRRDVDAVVAIGCVVQGQTKHDEVITHATARSLQAISLETGVPVALGITGPGMTWQQAEARIGNAAHAVDAALQMWAAVRTA